MNIERREWEAFYLYMNFLISFMYRIQRVSNYPEGKLNVPFLYRLIFQKAIGESNRIWYKHNKRIFSSLIGLDKDKKRTLKTIWDNYAINPSAPFLDFFHGKKKGEESLANIWRRYETNEKGGRSVLSHVERLKLTHSVNKLKFMLIFEKKKNYKYFSFLLFPSYSSKTSKS